MAHLCQHAVLFEISQVSLNDSVAVVQQIERPAEIALVFRTMTPRRGMRLAGYGYYIKYCAALAACFQSAAKGGDRAVGLTT